ncbi:MAG: hypothetical protein H0T76_17825 [Nannocystis sp.]|nr:hypothetical protein [Nannocystis sp.]MBA3548344.1 hypothetical protein [Nannocystis sp.]
MATPPPPAIFVIFGICMLIGAAAFGALGINQMELHCDAAADVCTVTRRIPDRSNTVALAKVSAAKVVARPKAGEIDAVLVDGAGTALLRMPVARAEVDRVVAELGELLAGTRDGVHHVEPPSPVKIAAGGLMLVTGIAAITVGIRRLRASAR